MAFTAGALAGAIEMPHPTPFAVFSPRRLGTSLALWSSLISVALTLVLAQVIGVSYTAKMREQIGLNLAGLAFQTTDKLDQGMFERYREFQLISMRPTLGDPGVTPADKQRLLDQIQHTYPSYSWIGVTDMQGTVQAATAGILTGADVSARPWFGNALRNIHIGDVHDAKLLASKLPNPAGGLLRFVDIAFPYRGPDDRIVGVLAAHLSWAWAEEVQRSVITAPLAQRGIEAFIVAQDRRILLGSSALIGEQLATPSVAAAQEGQNGYEIERWPDGKDYLVGYSQSRGHRTYPGLGWSVVVRAQAEQAFAPVVALQKQVLWSGFIIALVFSMIGLLNARRVTRPLISLAAAARELRLGKRSALGVVPPSFVEVNELAASMSSLVDDLQSNQLALRELNATLEQRVKERTAQLSSSEVRLRTIADNVPAAISYIGTDQRYRFCNRKYTEWFHLDTQHVVGAKIIDVVGPAVYEQVVQHVEQVLLGRRVTFELSRGWGGTTQHLRVEYIPDLDSSGSTAGFYVLSHDVTDSKNVQLALQRDLLIDALTGLANRVAFLQQLESGVARARRSKSMLAVMFLDIDQFKAVNDAHGHEAGDRVLTEIGLRVRACVRETDMVARLSGDEFVVLIENLSNPEADSALVAEKILAAVAQPLIFGGEILQVSVSIGIMVSTGNDDAQTLLNKADSAMYQAKHAGRNDLVFFATTE